MSEYGVRIAGMPPVNVEFVEPGARPRAMSEIWNAEQIADFLARNPGPEMREVYVKVRFSTLAEYQEQIAAYQIRVDNDALRLDYPYDVPDPEQVY